YIPFRYQSIALLYEYVQWYLVRIAPVLLVLVLTVAGYPWLVKLLRTRRRRMWAAPKGARARVAVAYAEFRDLCRDFAMGRAAAPPVEFLRDFEEDAELAE